MSFDTLAPYYRTMEFVLAGGILQRCRTSFLSETRNARRALLLGEGPGRFLVRLLQTNPRVEITCLERSARMIAQARSQIAPCDAARVRFEQADALRWQPPRNEFDLVVANFFLDCLRPEELAALIPKSPPAPPRTPAGWWPISASRTPAGGAGAPARCSP